MRQRKTVVIMFRGVMASDAEYKAPVDDMPIIRGTGRLIAELKSHPGVAKIFVIAQDDATEDVLRWLALHNINGVRVEKHCPRHDIYIGACAMPFVGQPLTANDVMATRSWLTPTAAAGVH